MMNKMKLKFNRERFNKDMKRAFTLLTVVTNCFIISGVIHHWKPKAKPIYNYTNELNTELAAPFKEIAKIQEETTDYTSRKETY
jgi:glycopeptide antibiotics resistance protein